MVQLGAEDRCALARAVMEILDEWGLQAEDMVNVLGMPPEIKARSMGRFRGGESPFPDHPEVMKRAHYLLRIADALRTTYPTSAGMQKRWMQQRNRRFGSRSPLATMVGGGETGLVAVLAQLDCTYAWDLTGSKATYGET